MFGGYCLARCRYPCRGNTGCWPELFCAVVDCRTCVQTARQQFGAEQLAYIAAIAVDAALVYGDVPKDVTFRRLLAIPTLRDLDESFGQQSWLNYRELLTGEPP